MSYSPRSPTSPEDWMPRGHYSSNSSRSMSQTSKSQSFASATNRAYSTTQFEGNAKIYHAELKLFLRDIIAQEAINGPHPHRVAARQKLAKLSNLQFHELAMDVYDEVVRRNKNDKYLPFLPVKEEFHPKRNQARQKLATLQTTRFDDLASDVYFELGRRYTLAEKDDKHNHPPIPPIPRNNSNQPLPSKSTNIIPVKGTMNVEDITDDDILPDSPTLAPGSPIASNKEPKDYFSRSAPNDNNNQINNGVDVEKMKADYEYQINNMKNRIKQLQNEIEDSHQQKGSSSSSDRNLIDSLKRKEEESQDIIHDLETKYKHLNEKYEDLNQDYNQQQEAVQNVKNETKQMLEELKKLAQANEMLLAEKEKAENEIEALKEEVRDWQKKYDKSRIEIRSLKASSTIESDTSSDLIKENLLQPTRNGIVPQDYIFTYQAYLDDLLKAARSKEPTQVIQIMKTIVTVCRSITEEIEKNENTLSMSTKNSLYDLKTRFSTSLSDLLMAAKYHASGMGLSPVSLLDRAAGHLSFVIIELAKLLGMNSNPTEPIKPKSAISSMLSSLNDDSNYGHHHYANKKSDNFDYYGSSLLNRTISNGTNYKNTNSTKDSHSKSYSRPGFDSYYNNDKEMYSKKSYQRQDTKPEMNPEELVKYLKKETDSIVETIQSLLGAIKMSQPSDEAHNIITSLLKIVASITKLSKATLESSSGYIYRRECEPILSELDKCSHRISMLQDKYFVKGAMATATAKRDLAKEAYEIAKFTKELINLFES